MEIFEDSYKENKLSRDKSEHGVGLTRGYLF